MRAHQGRYDSAQGEVQLVVTEDGYELLKLVAVDAPDADGHARLASGVLFERFA